MSTTNTPTQGQQFRFVAKSGSFQFGAKKVRVTNAYIIDDIQTAISYGNEEVLAQIWARLNTSDPT